MIAWKPLRLNQLCGYKFCGRGYKGFLIYQGSSSDQLKKDLLDLLGECLSMLFTIRLTFLVKELVDETI